MGNLNWRRAIGRGTRRRRDDGGLFVAGRPQKVHRRRPLADTNERPLRISPDPWLCKHVAYWQIVLKKSAN